MISRLFADEFLEYVDVGNKTSIDIFPVIFNGGVESTMLTPENIVKLYEFITRDRFKENIENSIKSLNRSINTYLVSTRDDAAIYPDEFIYMDINLENVKQLMRILNGIKKHIL